MTERIRVLVVDDHPMFAQALEMLIETEPTLEFAGSAGSGEAAVAAVRERPPDVILMDIDLPGISGIDATKQIKALAPEIQIVAITAFQDREVIAQVVQAGACGFVPKTEAPDRLLETVRRAATGELVLPSRDVGPVLARLQERHRARTDAEWLLGTLTPREREVLEMIRQGLSTAEIAKTLFIGQSTAQTHIKNILGKLGVHSKLEAVTFAMRNEEIGSSSSPWVARLERD